jgi:IS4 transposase
VIRLKKSNYKKERKAMKTKDGFVNIILTNQRISSSKASETIKKEFKKLGKMNLRITTITLKNRKEEYLISNLPMNKFTHNDIKEIYKLRWEVETLYDRLKNLLLVENVRGRTKLIVKKLCNNYYSYSNKHNNSTYTINNYPS